jgi:hypothetical protein
VIAERTRYTFPNTTDENPGWLSPSQVTEFLSCGACYELGRIRKIPRPLSVNLPIGSAVHKAIESARLEVSLDNAIQAAADYFDAECAQPMDPETGEALDVLEIDLGSKFENLGQVKDQVVRLAEFAVPQILKLDHKRGKIAATEWNLSMLASPWPFAVQGRLDALYVDYLADASKPELATVMADLKTSSKQEAPDEFTAVAQGIYREFWLARNLPLVAIADVVSKAQSPSLRSYVLSSDEYSRKLTYDTVMEVAEDISAGRFRPHPGWRCNYVHGFAEFQVAVSGFPE